MKQTLVVVLLGLVMISTVVYSESKIPDGFHGEWTTSVVKEKGFPWWSQVKYPILLIISDSGVILEDQTNTRCAPTVAFYDDEIEALVVMHCGTMKSPNAFPTYYKLTLSGQQMSGEVWTFKQLFKFVASRGGEPNKGSTITIPAN